MFFRFTLRMIVGDYYSKKYGKERQLDLTVPRQIAKEENRSVFSMWLKMMWSMMVTGCTFKEYYNLNFIKRKLKNQKTFITTGSNLKAYKKLNDEGFYHFYLHKDEFNEKYGQFVGRDWIRLSQEKAKIYEFFKAHDALILKPRDGDSGKGIVIVRDCSKLSDTEIDDLIRGNESGIAEQLLYNHPKLNELNPTSLNTMRIITVRNGDAMQILFAGIRYGAKGSQIDNISTGGHIAPIDPQSGKIFRSSHTKKSVSAEKSADHTGFQMPMWDQLHDFLYKLTAVIPQMRYMAWDIAITETGFVAIEGNHSSGNTVIQAHLGTAEQGLRVKLNQFTAKIKQ